VLREDQVQRYGRQILLREVGGKGQQRLLERPVRVLGRDDAVDVAVAYLVAGGTAVSGELPRDGSLSGFAHGVPLDTFSPDAASERPPFAALSVAGQGGAAGGVAVIVGPDGLAWAGPDACPRCLDAAARELAGAPIDAVLLGTLAALVLQRLALGLDGASPFPAVLQWREGALHGRDGARCPEHPPKA
jgi:hypothetical protein